MPAKLIGVMLFASLTGGNYPPTTAPINSMFRDYADCVAARDDMRRKGRVTVEDREFGYRTMVECYPDGDAPPAAPKRIVPPTGYDIIPAPGRGPNIRVPEQYGAGGPVPLSGPYPWPQDH